MLAEFTLNTTARELIVISSAIQSSETLRRSESNVEKISGKRSEDTLQG